jgi:hypothetical protein
MYKHIYSLLILSLLSAESVAQSKLSAAVLQELDKAEQLMFSATEKGDSTLFRKISGKDYFTINANGVSQTLDEACVLVPRFKGSKAVLSEQNVRVFDKFALRTGRAKIYVGEQQVAEFLYTSGWIYRDSRWQFVHWQGTPTGMMLAMMQQGSAVMEPPKN